jgi:hypothetical protein
MMLAYRCSNCGTELQTSNREGLEEFVNLVKQVREAQKKYFKTRDRNDLVASKQLERRLDDALANG